MALRLAALPRMKPHLLEALRDPEDRLLRSSTFGTPYPFRQFAIIEIYRDISKQTLLGHQYKSILYYNKSQGGKTKFLIS